MRALLLDTHTLVWALSDPTRLGSAARGALTEPGLARWVSAATVWELAIKCSLGKLTLGVSLGHLVREVLPASGLGLLDIRPEHAIEVEHLPFHHRDPFDRLLVAQVRVEGLTLVSADTQLDAYGVTRVW